jgi:hypothetical protein
MTFYYQNTYHLSQVQAVAVLGVYWELLGFSGGLVPHGFSHSHNERIPDGVPIS